MRGVNWKKNICKYVKVLGWPECLSRDIQGDTKLTGHFIHGVTLFKLKIMRSNKA